MGPMVYASLGLISVGVLSTAIWVQINGQKTKQQLAEIITLLKSCAKGEGSGPKGLDGQESSGQGA